jgi:hypothetical protein
MPDSRFDFASPYDLMVGLWSGMCTVFDARGEFFSVTPSMVAVFWKRRPTLLHYHQIEQHFPTPGKPGKLRVKPIPKLEDVDPQRGITGHDAVAETTNLHFDLHVDGKYCMAKLTGATGLQSVEGTQTRPGVYIFHLGFQGWRYYNNQYFTDPNERHIIGPCLREDNPNLAFVAAQSFHRVSYDVPRALQKDIET